MKILSIVTIVALAMLSGCGSPPTKHNDHNVDDYPDKRVVHTESQIPYTWVGPRYLVSPGDQLEITYSITSQLQDNYLIDIGDQVRMEFYYYPQLDRTVNVRPDGRITVPYKGDVSAVGLTPTQLAEKLSEVYSDFLNRPRATVSLIRFGEKIRELKQAITTSERGQSRLVLVQPDGRIMLPLIPPIDAAGRTMDELKKEIDRCYARVIDGMATTATLLQATGNRIYVFGAVENPGFIQLQGPTTALQAVSMAGGFSDYAVKGSTLLVTRDEYRRPVGRIIDLETALGNGDLSQDVLLRQADIVYVPRSWLERAAITADAIYRIIPMSFSANYGISDDWDLIRSNP